MSEWRLKVPEEVVAALGDDPEREALEALLLHLIRTDRASVAWAGARLGIVRQEAIRWYTSHGYPFPDLTPEELDEEFRHAHATPEAARERAPEDEDPILSLAEDPFDNRRIPADASENLDDYLYGHGGPFDDEERG